MLKMVDGTGIIGVDMICPLGVSTPQPPNYDRVELESTGMLVLPNSLDAPLERLELSGKTEQVTTTGAQLITLANRTDVGDTELGGKKWLTKISEQAYSVWNNYQKATVEFLENNSFKLSHAGGSSANGNGLELPVKIKPNTDYVLSYASTISEVIVYFVQMDSECNKLKETSSKNKQHTFHSEATAEWVILKFTSIANNSYVVNNIQFEKGTIATAYEPYTGGKPSPSPEYPQEIKNSGKRNDEKQKYDVDVKVTGKNLLNLRNPSVRFDRCILQGDGSIKSDIRSNYYFCSIYVDDPYVVDNIKNDQAITFSIGKGIQNRSITISLHGERVGSVNYQEKSSVPGGNSVSIVPSGFKKVSKIELQFNRSGSLFTDTETVVRDFMIHFGESTPYQPYTEQTMQIALDEPLRGIGEYNDVLTKDGVVMKVKRVVLDGSEDEEWRIDRRFENHINFALVIKGAITVNTGIRTMMDKFKYVRSIWNNDSPGQDMFDAKLRINMPKTLATDLQTFKTWLSQNPLTVDYVLAEPVTEPLPESVQAQLQALHSENGVTHVFVDSGEVPCGIKLTYRKEI